MRALIFAGLLFLSACGFAPLYAPGSGAAIGPVSIGMVEGKAGHVLRTELDRLLRAEAGAVGTPSALDIRLTEQVVPLGIRLDESATRAEMRLTANYTFTPGAGGAEALRGSVNAVVTYDIPTAAFGEITAQDDARERCAETLAQRMRAELALRLAQSRRP